MSDIFYSFDPATGVFTGTTVKQNKPGILSGPAHSTNIAPPAAIPAGRAAAFIGGAWTTIEDHRGKVFYDGERSVTITRVGPVPEGLTASPVTVKRTEPELSDAMKTLKSLGYDTIEEAVVTLVAASGGRPAQ